MAASSKVMVTEATRSSPASSSAAPLLPKEKFRNSSNIPPKARKISSGLVKP
jgi:hypothetical protein